MDNYYKILGLPSSATSEEIRRAYRILARRYHPDVNPGKSSEEKFKAIAAAYQILSDDEKRKNYDIEIEHIVARSARAKIRAYEDAFREAIKRESAKVRERDSKPTSNSSSKFPQPSAVLLPLKQSINTFINNAKNSFNSIATFPSRIFRRSRDFKGGKKVTKISLIEVSVTIQDAIKGVRRTIEIDEGEEIRKVSVRIPPGVRTGSVVRLRGTKDPFEEIVLIVRVAFHPYISIAPKGIVIEVPISVGEAINGAKISAPTLEDPTMITIPPGTQSGTEIRLVGQGISQKDSSRGDIFYKVMIKVPETPEAVGIKERASELESYYGAPVRHGFPTTITG